MISYNNYNYYSTKNSISTILFSDFDRPAKKGRQAGQGATDGDDTYSQRGP